MNISSSGEHMGNWTWNFFENHSTSVFDNFAELLPLTFVETCYTEDHTVKQIICNVTVSYLIQHDFEFSLFVLGSMKSSSLACIFNNITRFGRGSFFKCRTACGSFWRFIDLESGQNEHSALYWSDFDQVGHSTQFLITCLYIDWVANFAQILFLSSLLSN